MSADPVASPAAVSRLLTEAAAVLTEGGVASPAHDARVLLAHVLDRTPSALLSVVAVPAGAATRFRALVGRRAERVPLQHLTGIAYFRHTALQVGPGVFVPRPETELMTGWVIDRLRERACADRPLVVVDLCTGSGAVARSVATELGATVSVEVHAVEVSEVAARWAERNLAGTGVRLEIADMAGALPQLDDTVDLVVANPPYIPLEAYPSVEPEARDHDPAVALFSGADGLDAIRTVVVTATRLLRPGGLLAYEHAEVQAESAPALAVASGAFHSVRDRRDLLDRPRFVTAVRRGGLAGWTE